jgi:transcription elongation GreA/GreB family factor
MTGAEQTLTLISSNGNLIDDKTISVNSPVGEQLLGKRKGEEFAVVFERDEIGKGNVRRAERYKILKICAGEEEETQQN